MHPWIFLENHVCNPFSVEFQQTLLVIGDLCCDWIPDWLHDTSCNQLHMCGRTSRCTYTSKRSGSLDLYMHKYYQIFRILFKTACTVVKLKLLRSQSTTAACMHACMHVPKERKMHASRIPFSHPTHALPHPHNTQSCHALPMLLK